MLLEQLRNLPPYKAPELVIYGTVAALTAGGSNGLVEFAPFGFCSNGPGQPNRVIC
jgi:hypothetical protein